VSVAPVSFTPPTKGITLDTTDHFPLRSIATLA